MPDDKTPIKIKFVDGSFDDFDGTQEELDEIFSEITRFLQSDEFAAALNSATESDDEEDFNPDLWEKFEKNSTRTIH